MAAADETPDGHPGSKVLQRCQAIEPDDGNENADARFGQPGRHT